jgi:pyrimidine-nucleoside phosphorylase
MSGRGLGHTGGTLDKLESIAGFRTELGLEEMSAQVRRIGCALVGQSPALVPADGALYSLRDVTATVDSVPLIASSIMSKKLAGGAGTIVLDVKWGSGAFMTTQEAARELAGALVRIGEGAGRRTRAVLSSMREPLGRAVGNALEVREALDTLNGGGPADLWALTLELGTHLMLLSGLASSADEAVRTLTPCATRGRPRGGWRCWWRRRAATRASSPGPDLLPAAPVVRTVAAHADGWVAEADARTIAEAALELGAGRLRKGDPWIPRSAWWSSRASATAWPPARPWPRCTPAADAAAEAAEARLRDAFRLAPEAVAAQGEAYETVG